MRPVRWSTHARRDYLDILQFISEDNPSAAERVLNALERTGNELGEFATGRPGRVPSIYEKRVERLPYVIAYALPVDRNGESVFILRVIHTARNWPDNEWPE